MFGILALQAETPAIKEKLIPPVLRGSDGTIRLMSGVPLPPRIKGVRTKIAIIDSGMFSEHPQLVGLVAVQKDFTDGNDPHDEAGHGTLVALQTLRGVEEVRSKAIASGMKLRDSTTLFINAKVTSSTVAPTKARLIAAIRWVAEQGAEVVNISVGLRGTAEEYADLCDEIAKTNASFFTAAGVVDDDGDLYPAQCAVPNLMSVDSANSVTGTASIQVEDDTALVLDRSLYLLEEGRRAARASDFDRAIQLFNESLEISRTAEAHFQLSTIAYARGDIAGSDEQLRQGLALDPNDVGCNAQMGSLLLNSGHAAEAIPYLRKAIAVRPTARELIPFRVNLAIALVRTLKFDEGRTELERILKDDPSNSQAKELLTDLNQKLSHSPNE
jgi:tetratricopeptide (TPR) repeat protein